MDSPDAEKEKYGSQMDCGERLEFDPVEKQRKGKGVMWRLEKAMVWEGRTWEENSREGQRGYSGFY